MEKRKVVWICTLIFLLAGCSSSFSSLDIGAGNGLSKNQVLLIGLFGTVSQLDPVDMGQGSVIILNNVNEGLFRIRKDNQVEPAVAEEYTVSEDKKLYSFKLRKDAKWSDNRPVTAHDFEFAWKRAVHPNIKGDSASLFYPIENARRYHTGKAKKEEVGVRAVDDYTFEVKLEKPDPYFIQRLASPAFFPVREDMVKKYGYQFGLKHETVLYNGPFVVQQWDPSKVVLKKNPYYWDRNHVTLERVEFLILNNPKKEIELFYADKLHAIALQDYTAAYRNSPEFIQVEDGVTVFLNFNYKNKFLVNKNIRKAIALAIDRNVLTNTILKNGAKPANGLVPPTINVGGKPFHNGNSPYLKYDKKQAQKYLKKGLEELKLSKLPELHLITVYEDIAVDIKRQLRENLGLEVKLMKAPTFDAYKKYEADLEIREWKASHNDPMSFLDIFDSKSDFNTFHFKNKDYDTLIDKEHELTDLQQKQKVALQAERLLVEKLVAVVPLYYEGSSFLQKKYVKDLYRHPFVADLSLKWAYISDERDK
ncbi:peptide ABC transporter substrate-binding protein [Thermoflavimicrobium dichotomicum]|uniref:Oligopeptide transport system substrate-binding protein n=1 Tax=Thermoflavimicrobium dichotomicum TaxID=46223 RepID=A0A1I3MID7_9BACL|nr:peptide ABC transporter substrate-binding protein [Thermoflavimicrobium dichotomicum]SFI96787.1 oligopeptide transport system substrate-binding protein [Thermoflavimicrobium dichotomicum]